MEVIGGILLGPSALGQVSSFQLSIFPVASIKYIDLVATVGLVLYLFVIGLELDPKLLYKNGKVCACAECARCVVHYYLQHTVFISICGIALPFVIGLAIAPILYSELMPKTVHFTPFAVFLGVSMSITAFPVLARVLTETGLLTCTAGQITMGAAAMDDIVAWSLLTVAISLAASSNMTVHAKRPVTGRHSRVCLACTGGGVHLPLCGCICGRDSWLC
jgi:Kef-type K+ transport system membrane component KefB